jgi:phosphatidylglycerophosphate synthase
VELSPLYPVKVAALVVITAIVAMPGLKRHHPFARFGPANTVTALRALLVSVVAGLIGERSSNEAAWAAAGVGVLATVLDGADGWLARRTSLASDFGARFDMEVDALLILVLSVLAWQLGKAGVWVLVSGLLRYVFVAAGWIWRWLQAPLPPSWRGKAVCVVQVAALILAIAPFVRWPASAATAAAGLAALSWSFLVDVMRLWRGSDR